MEIAFKPKESNRNRWEIIVEGEKWQEVHRTIFGRNPALKTTSPITNERELKSAFDSYEYHQVKKYVLWRLSSQSIHSEQLIKLLQDRLVQDHTIARVIREFREMAILDDQAWIQGYMKSQQKRVSLRLALAKLRIKGFSSETIQQLAYQWKDPDEELKALKHLLQTRYKSKDLSDYKSRQKVMAALMRKGYSYEQVQEAIWQLKGR